MIDDGDVQILLGDALEQLRTLPSESVQCIVTSPPFWGLRDYGVEGQIGLEETPEEWVERLVSVFREARRVLRSDGVAWVECGDTYNSGTSAARSASSASDHGGWANGGAHGDRRANATGLKPTAGTYDRTQSGAGRIRCRRASPTAPRRRTATCSC